MVTLSKSKSARPVDEKAFPLQPPPSYADEHVDISAAFSNLSLSSHGSNFPSEDECIAHLKILEAFHLLKEDIALKNGLYDIYDNFMPTGSTDRYAKETLERIREKRWAVFVCKAVKRFQTWFTTQLQPEAEMLNLTAMGQTGYKNIAAEARPLAMDAERLPPLDVLMVWHSFILNPRTYLADCIRFGKTSLWATGLPWKSIDSVIDANTLAYEPNDTAKARWVGSTDSPWDPLDEPDTVTVSCPRCNRASIQPWTTCTHPGHFTSNSASAYQAKGYADPGFKVGCQCGMIIDHDMLRCFKFMADLKHLVVHDVPMPSTLLSLDGKPVSYKEVVDSRKGTADLMLPNQLLRDGRLARAFGDSNDPKVASPAAIRSLFQKAITKDNLWLQVTLKNAHQLALRPVQRMSIRKLMACYWDNSSIFSMDLVGAVIRQGVFVTKMHNIDWLHSPALKSTMRRLITKYERFFMIMAKYPEEIAVPTLDVDLAWHTHQLSPQAYYNYSIATTNDVFVNHDDKIADSKLSTSFEWTSKTYQKLFNSLYSECTCWYCEAIRESSNSGLKRLFNSESDGLKSELHQLHSGSSCDDPSKAAHISTHNAIRAIDLHQAEEVERVHKRKLETGYHRACARAKKAGRAPPARDAYAARYGFYPYAAYPFWAPIYVTTPACGSFTAGAIGNCCTGTCGGGVAMGSCAGAAGSCAGGGGGGCGGGGDAGGGGGGGGGCGGGGGDAGGGGGGGGCGGCGGG